MSDPSEPRQPPRPPQFTPPDYPPTAQFPPVDPHAGYQPSPTGYGGPPGYGPPGQPPPGYGPPPPGYEPRPPRRSNTPLIALILAVTLLLCGGVVTASVIMARQAADKAEEIAEPILNPTLPEILPTEAPDLPGLPTGFPDLPTVPTDIPGLGEGREISVTYEVTGDGAAEILYMEKLDDTPKRVSNAKLPWKMTTTMKSPAVVSVIAMRTDIGNGSVACKATVDGEQVAQQSADGTLATANCYKLIIN